MRKSLIVHSRAVSSVPKQRQFDLPLLSGRLVTLCRSGAVLGLSVLLAVVGTARAASLTLSSDSASGTVLDKNGAGSGFTARMPGSRADLFGNDTGLLLRAANGELQLRTASGTDFNGWIDFGGSLNCRVGLQELSHPPEVGTGPNSCRLTPREIETGTNGVARIHQFDSPAANPNTDCTHIRHFGLNFVNEASTEHNRRHATIVGASARPGHPVNSAMSGHLRYPVP